MVSCVPRPSLRSVVPHLVGAWSGKVCGQLCHIWWAAKAKSVVSCATSGGCMVRQGLRSVVPHLVGAWSGKAKVCGQLCHIWWVHDQPRPRSAVSCATSGGCMIRQGQGLRSVVYQGHSALGGCIVSRSILGGDFPSIQSLPDT